MEEKSTFIREETILYILIQFEIEMMHNINSFIYKEKNGFCKSELLFT